MKKIFKALALVAIVATAPIALAQNMMNMGIGPAVSGSEQTSSLPGKARKFVEKHFKNVAIARVQKDFTDGEYEATLADGTQIEFSSKGDFREVDARDNGVLNAAVVKSILPDKTYRTLEKKGLAERVDGIKMDGKRYQIEVKHRRVDEIVIHEDGTIITIEYDD